MTPADTGGMNMECGLMERVTTLARQVQARDRQI